MTKFKEFFQFFRRTVVNGSILVSMENDNRASDLFDVFIGRELITEHGNRDEAGIVPCQILEVVIRCVKD